MFKHLLNFFIFIILTSCSPKIISPKFAIYNTDNPQIIVDSILRSNNIKPSDYKTWDSFEAYNDSIIKTYVFPFDNKVLSIQNDSIIILKLL